MVRRQWIHRTAKTEMVEAGMIEVAQWRQGDGDKATDLVLPWRHGGNNEPKTTTPPMTAKDPQQEPWLPGQQHIWPWYWSRQPHWQSLLGVGGKLIVQCRTTNASEFF